MSIDEQSILAEAKKVMDDFMQELNKASVDEEHFGQSRSTSIREDFEQDKDNDEYRSRFFKNAPNKLGDNIIVPDSLK